MSLTKNKPVNKIRQKHKADEVLCINNYDKEEQKIEEMMIVFFKNGNTDQEIYRWLGFIHPSEDREWIADVRREFNKSIKSKTSIDKL